MARPVKDGLDYFPKDTGFYRDRKIRALIGRFGCDGAALYDYILCEVYGDKGYYTEIDDSFVDIAAADLGISPEKIGLILNYLLDKSMLLDGTLFKAVKVLTSRGIQTRYQEAVRERAKKRGICVHGELWLLNEAESESFVEVRHNESLSLKNSSKSGKNSSKSMEESIKESKGKESITPLPPKGGMGTKPGKRESHFALKEDAKILLRDYVGDDEELHKVLGEFIRIRQDLRAVNSKQGISSLLRELERLSGGDRALKLQLIRQSCANSWKSVFPIRSSGEDTAKGGSLPEPEVRNGVR